MTGKDASPAPPTGMVVRFLMVIVLSLGTAATFYAVMLAAGPAEREHTVQCRKQAGINTVTGVGSTEAYRNFNRCDTANIRREFRNLLTGALVVALGAALFYRFQPAYKRRRQRLVPLTSLGEGIAPVQERIDQLVAEAGLASTPDIVVDPLSRDAGGLAFGRFRRPAIRLDAGLLTRFSSDPAAFDTVVRHELAHVRNGDIGITYLTMAVWRSFVLLALVPVLVVELYSIWQVARSTGEPLRAIGAGLTGTGWRIAALILVVYLARNTVLQGREIAADVRAGSGDVPERPEAGGVARIVAAIRFRFGTHPSPQLRRRAAQEPTGVVPLTPLEMLLAGCTITVACDAVYPILYFLPTSRLVLVYTLSVLFATAFAGLLVVAGWRWIIAADQRRPTPRLLIVPALAATAGLVLGRFVSLASYGQTGSFVRFFPTRAGLLLVAELLAVAVLLPLWAAYCLRIRRAATGSEPSRGPIALILLSGVLIAYAWIGTWAIPGWDITRRATVAISAAAGTTAASAQWSPFDRPIGVIAMNPIHLFEGSAAIALVAALLPWLVPVALAGPGLIGSRALRAGVAGGLAAVAADLVLRAGLRLTVSPEVRQETAFVFVVFCIEVCVLLVVQVVVAAVVASRAGPGRVVGGLFAAFVSVLVGVAGMSVWSVLSGCVPGVALRAASCAPGATVGFLFATWRAATVTGLVLALAGVGLGITAARYRDRRRATADVVPAAATTRSHRKVVAGLVLLTLLWTAGTAIARPHTAPEGRDYTAGFAIPANVSLMNRGGTTAEQAEAWRSGGGSQAIADLARALNSLYGSLNADVTTSLAGDLRIAADALALARTFPPIPDAAVQKQWATALQLAEKALAGTDAYDRSPGSYDRILVIFSLLEAMVNLFETSDQLKALIAKGG
ncbi:M48 family metalloprotease [Actinoplanes solisilvae]|uniref:M48 family metalloprotease n=1 Tax=Actinoplanes solisilvae TaxID=2486853 RepID=UPI000FDA5DFA|nr:M48 family metalloprotease [Actinoplanes solisilvae]